MHSYMLVDDNSNHTFIIYFCKTSVSSSFTNDACKYFAHLAQI